MSNIVHWHSKKFEKSTLMDVLARLMQKTNISMSQLSRNTGLANTTIKRMCTDPRCNPTFTSIIKISEFFNITPNQLMGREPLSQESSYKPNFDRWLVAPILSLQQLILWPTNIEEIKESSHTKYVKTDLEISERVFAIVTHDDSLEPRFPVGTILIFDPERTPRNKDYVILLMEDKHLPQFRQILVDGPDWYAKIINLELPQTSPFFIDKSKNKILGSLIQAKLNYIEQN